jgi:methanethiol S-methyltransferase
MRTAFFVYGLVAYLLFAATLVYAIGFLGGFGVPLSVDAGQAVVPAGLALLVNAGLLLVFALQHSVMARPAFKRLWTRIVPAPIERSTYVVASCVALWLVFWQWRPVPAVVWDLGPPSLRTALWILFAAGWILILVSSLQISHLELFGLKQVWHNLRQSRPEKEPFAEPFLYRIVRHPLYVGWLLTFWATPTMTVGHLAFALVTTGYILVAIRFEEHDLRARHPEYAGYSRRVPMLIPRWTARKDLVPAQPLKPLARSVPES